jgi:hypothetical protein
MMIDLATEYLAYIGSYNRNYKKPSGRIMNKIPILFVYKLATGIWG